MYICVDGKFQLKTSKKEANKGGVSSFSIQFCTNCKTT